MNVTTSNPACLRKIAIESDERLQMPLLFYQVGTADNMNLFNTAVHWLASARPVEPRRPWYMDASLYIDGIAVHGRFTCRISLIWKTWRSQLTR